jgi:ribonucleoside-diphosphate reductase alpha chain
MNPGHLTPQALRVLEARYLRREKDGNIAETPEALFFRVAQAVAQAEATLGDPTRQGYWQETFEQLLTSLDFLPNSPALFNAGNQAGQLSACFVLPVADSLEDIFETLKHAALIQRSGGGTGFSFSSLRPNGDVVHSTGGKASGPVAFMKIFDETTEHIKQGGKRRGANMGVLRVDHPDIQEFIHAKIDGTSLRNFNISVGVTDRFLETVRNDGDFDLIHPLTKRPTARVKAKSLFQDIADAAWQSGDPGILFLDTINRANPTPGLGNLEATNPCGEIPLLPHESCNLGSLNLPHFLASDAHGPFMNWEKLQTAVHQAVRFLDNLIEINHFPTAAIASQSKGNRKIGLGVMGLAEVLIRLGLPYTSNEALHFGKNLMKFISEEAHRASEHLAGERGVFPNWAHSVFAPANQPRRNATCTAIAPTGTLSLIAGTTASIEPLFALVYRRSHSLGGKPLYEMTPLFWQYCRAEGIDTKQLAEKVFHQGTISHLSNIPSRIKELFLTALEIPPEKHLQMQAAFQQYVDNSVSKTINMPKDTTCEDVAHAYWRAWELGLKGVTIYRYGSKDSQVMEVGAEVDPRLLEQSAHCDPGECRI